MPFFEMMKTPDYRSYLDFCIINENNEIVSFCTLWYDEVNKYSSLEPVGTIPEYRRKGLVKAVIYEGLKQIKKIGAKHCLSTDQQFYLDIGFELYYNVDVYHREF